MKRASKYYVPELDKEIKVECISTSTYVAHYPTGPERASFQEVRGSDWEYRGQWNDEETE